MADVDGLTHSLYCVACYTKKNENGNKKLVPAEFVYAGASLCKEHFEMAWNRVEQMQKQNQQKQEQSAKQ